MTELLPFFTCPHFPFSTPSDSSSFPRRDAPYYCPTKVVHFRCDDGHVMEDGGSTGDKVRDSPSVCHTHVPCPLLLHSGEIFGLDEVSCPGHPDVVVGPTGLSINIFVVKAEKKARRRLARAELVVRHQLKLAGSQETPQSPTCESSVFSTPGRS